MARLRSPTTRERVTERAKTETRANGLDWANEPMPPSLPPSSLCVGTYCIKTIIVCLSIMDAHGLCMYIHVCSYKLVRVCLRTDTIVVYTR